MSREQMVPALIAALLREGVEPSVIEGAVARAVDTATLGKSIMGTESQFDRERIAFCFDQARIIKDAWSA